MAGAAPVEVRCLGVFALTINGRTVERWRAGKARELLQFLLLRPGRVVPRDTLCDALWPDSPGTGRTRGSLKVAVHALRRILDDHLGLDGRDVDTQPLRVITVEQGYLLDVDRLHIDFEVFDELVDRAHRADTAHSTTEAAARFRAAVELYGGDFLAEVDAEWACVQREWLRSRYLYALQRLAELDLAAQDHLSVVRWCRRMIDAEPLCEQAYRTLMVAHAELGQLSQVHRWYQLCVRRLREVLQAPPDPVTEQAYSRALRRG
ncbi:AfsR/SARP family transcriptional regulator [Actinophytocola xanthii]|uniref:OmpR/PhoB-type domain-containing protein n=1 Tax=Actinophytocola xanthii TaxID=1912961 RepID=A0A1Q8CK43_9PSEU|nr:BTAD domain-containing putative transcriptional regulator [Actinophytocola xanthii]OLF14703.1 hypothetical protein BU204_25780 [Actinophytocola xanthii]